MTDKVSSEESQRVGKYENGFCQCVVCNIEMLSVGTVLCII